MSDKEFPYNKFNFALSVIGFIGSLAFYYGVLKNIKKEENSQQKMEQLRKENSQLKKQLKSIQ